MVSIEACRRHPRVQAGWRCGTCGLALCPDCTGVHKVGRIETPVCGACGNRAEPLRVHRSARPFSGRIVPALRYPLSRSVALSLVALAVFQAILSYRGFGPPPAIVLMALVSAGAFWSYFFFIIKSTADGEAVLGVPDFRDLRQDLLVPVLNGVLAGSLIWIPVLIYVLVTRGLSLDALDAIATFEDPVLWAMAALGAAYVPIALLAAATECGFLDIVNPVRNVLAIRRMGRDYWIALGALAVLGVGQIIVQITIAPLLFALPIPFVCRVLAIAAGLYFPFVMARVLGEVLHVRGDALEWGNAEDYYDLALPGVAPRGSAPTTAAPAPAQKAPAPEPAVPLSPEQQFTSGLGAAKARDFAGAIRALKAAAHSDDPVAPRAMVALAQIYADGIGDLENAARVYREATKRFPGTDAARFAEQKLASLA